MTQQTGASGGTTNNNQPASPDHSNRNLLIYLALAVGLYFGVKALYRKYTASHPSNVAAASTNRNGRPVSSRPPVAQPPADAATPLAQAEPAPADTEQDEPDEEVDAGAQAQADEPDAVITSDQPQVPQQPAAVAQPATRPPPVTRQGWTCPAGRRCVSGADAPSQTCNNANGGANDGLCFRRFSMANVRLVDILSDQRSTCAPGRMCVDCRNLTDRESGWRIWARDNSTRNDLSRCAVILP